MRTPEVIQSVKELRHPVRGKLILLWDGLTAHRSKATLAFLKTQRHWLTVTRFPAYAPELHPPEYLWSSGKRKEFANFCPDTPQDLTRQIRRFTRRARRYPNLWKGFLKKATLFH